MTDAIRENDTYKIVIGTSTMHEGSREMQCYQLVNKETGLVESETTVLPQAIDWMVEFERLLNNPDSRSMLDDLSIQHADQVKTVQ